MAQEQDRQQINDALLKYCRGIDRLDADEALAAFHPGALLVDYRPEPMTAETFIESILPSLKERYQATQHRISNTTIRFDTSTTVEPSTAMVETYVLAFHMEYDNQDTAPRLMTFNGRYIDRFEQRDGPWLIAHRNLRCDWSKVETVEATMGGGAWKFSGRGGTPDPFDV